MTWCMELSENKYVEICNVVVARSWLLWDTAGEESQYPFEYL